MVPEGEHPAPELVNLLTSDTLLDEVEALFPAVHRGDNGGAMGDRPQLKSS